MRMMPNVPARAGDAGRFTHRRFFVYVKDVDAAFKRAVAAGGISQMPVQDMFWGDRVGTLHDPFGYSWTLATHIADLSHRKRWPAAPKAMFAGTGKG